MGRNYPRFLYCETFNTKSEGPFIIHTLSPRFIVKLSFNAKRDRPIFTMVDNWENVELQEQWSIQKDMVTWYEYNGRMLSTHHKDKLLVALEAMDFWKDGQHDYTLNQVISVARICFPTKTKQVNEGHSSYGLKHKMEKISRTFVRPLDQKKYCSNELLKEAFTKLGFTATYVREGSQNCYYNISEKNIQTIDDLF